MNQNCPSDLIDYLVSRFFCNELEVIKVKMYYFDNTVQTNIITRECLEEIRLNCDYPSSSEDEEENEENESGENESEDPQ
jgi:hypothetical protein